MPPPNISYNEYIHEDIRIRMPSGKIKVFYEPFENTPVFNLEGSIFLENKLLQNFYNIEENIKFSSNSLNNKFIVLNGYLSEQNNLIFIWNTEPIDHFLCVTYNFNEEYFLNNKEINWLGEGF